MKKRSVGRPAEVSDSSVTSSPVRERALNAGAGVPGWSPSSGISSWLGDVDPRVGERRFDSVEPYEHVSVRAQEREEGGSSDGHDRRPRRTPTTSATSWALSRSPIQAKTLTPSPARLAWRARTRRLLRGRRCDRASASQPAPSEAARSNGSPESVRARGSQPIAALKMPSRTSAPSAPYAAVGSKGAGGPRRRARRLGAGGRVFQQLARARRRRRQRLACRRGRGSFASPASREHGCKDEPPGDGQDGNHQRTGDPLAGAFPAVVAGTAGRVTWVAAVRPLRAALAVLDRVGRLAADRLATRHQESGLGTARE